MQHKATWDPRFPGSIQRDYTVKVIFLLSHVDKDTIEIGEEKREFIERYAAVHAARYTKIHAPKTGSIDGYFLSLARLAKRFHLVSN